MNIDITKLATTAAFNAKLNGVKNKIPNITSLGTAAALTAVENKIHIGSNLVTKTENNTKIIEIENRITNDHDHDKYITTEEPNKSTSENFTSRIAQAYLEIKSDTVTLVRKTDLKKNELNEIPKKFKQYQQKD